MLLASALLALASTISLPATGNFHQESSRIYPLSARGQVLDSQGEWEQSKEPDPMARYGERSHDH